MDFEQIGQVLAEKEKTKRVKEQEEQQTKRKKMEYDHKERKKDKEWKQLMILLAVVVIIFPLINVIEDMTSGYPAKKRQHEERVALLQQIEAEIDEAILNKDFDTALLKANKLYLDDNWSDESAQTWESKRKAYLKIIEEKKREQDLSNPNNIFMSASSNTLKGKNYQDVVDQLTNAGFTNVSSQPAAISPGLFDKSNTVEHVLAGGKTTFTEEDYFDKDTPIIVYYYTR